MQTVKEPFYHMNYVTPLQRREELASLSLFLLFEIAAIPLKPLFFIDNLFSLPRFCSYQSLLIGCSLLLYFQIRKRARFAPLPPSPLLDPSEALIQSHEPMIENSESPVDIKLIHAEETILFLQKRLEETDSERKELQKLCESHAKESAYLKLKVESLFSLTKQLAQDMKKQSALAEEDRKRHSLEIRSLLMRETKIDDKNGTVGIFKRLSTNYLYTPSFQETSVESALSCLLTSCSEALDKDRKSDSSEKLGALSQEWPSTAYPHLVKRKLYESVTRLLRTDVGCTSLKNPSLELTLTSGIRSIQEDILLFIQDRQKELEVLTDLEPYYGRISAHLFVFFRCTQDQVHDIILFGISLKDGP